MEKFKKEKHFPAFLILVFTALTAVIIASGYLYFTSYENQYNSEIKLELGAIADLKVNELARWRNERLNDAKFFFENEEFTSQVKNFFANENDIKTRKKIISDFNHVYNALEYDALFLLDNKFNEKLTVCQGAKRIFSYISQKSIDSIKAGKIFFDDFYYNDVSNKIFLKIIVPVFDNAKKENLIGAVVLRIDPELYLYPFIERWPTPSKSAETLIVRREGSDVVFLNELRFQKNSALKSRFEIEKSKNLPAAKAVLGNNGFTQGFDYRGEPVLAVTRSIPNSPWFIVARIDKSELYKSFSDRMWIVLFLIFSTLIGIAAIFGLIWRHQRSKFYKEKLESAQRLKKSEENLEITLNSIGDGVISTDNSGNVIRMNPVAEKLCGWNFAEAAGKPLEEIFKIINAETRIPELNPVKRVIETGNIIGLANHTVLVSKDGSEYQIADSAAPIRNENNDIMGVVLVFSDVTEEYAVQTELKSSERFLKEAQKIARLGIYTLDIQKGYWESSDILNEIFGIEKDFDKSIPGWASIIHPDWQKMMTDYFINDVVGKKGRFDKEYKIIRQSDKSERWVHGFGELIFNDDNQPVKMIGTIQDITERNLAEEKIRISENNLSITLNSIGDGVISTDAKGNVTRMNPVADNLCGWKIEDATGKPLIEIFKIINSESGETVENPVNLVMETGKVIGLANHTVLISKDGTKYQIADSAAPIKNEEDKILGVVLTFSDVTQKYSIQSALTKSEALLSRGELVAGFGNWELDLTNRQMRASKGARKIYGLQEEEWSLEFIQDFVLPGYRKMLDESLQKLLEKNEPYDVVYKIKRKSDGKLLDIHSTAQYDKDAKKLFGVIQDVTERKRLEEERESTIQLLALINVQNNTKKLMEEVGLMMKEWSGCESIGIRLKDKEDYPYYVSDGFGKEFIVKENSLCSVDEDGKILRDSKGNPILECMCGNVIKCRTNSSKQFFTEHGSFWTNSTSDLLGSTTEEDRQSRTRNRCHGEGYESVALIPLRTGDETFGLLQFNDRQRNRFTKEKIQLYERLADNLAIAFSQKKAQSNLRESELKHRTLFETMHQGVVYADKGGKIIDANFAAQEILGVEYNELKKCFVFDQIWQAIKEDGSKFEKEEFPVMQSLKTAKETKNVVMGIFNQKSGRRLWLNINAIPQFEGEDLIPKQILTTFEDITERKIFNERIQNSLREKEILLREIHHRVKNNFQVINSLLSLQSNLYTDQNILNIFRESQNRIKSMSLIHELVYKAEDFNYLDLQNYVISLIEYIKQSYSVGENNIKTAFEIDKIEMQLDELIPIGLILNELISNIYKHAFPDGRDGNIRISIKKNTGGHFTLIVCDDGIGMPTDYDLLERKSLGMFLVNSLTRQIKGDMTVTDKSPGTEFMIRFRN